MTAQQIIASIEWVEVNGRVAEDARRVMQEERFALVAACQAGDGRRITAACREAQRVAKMWQIDLSRPLETTSV